ncbi:Fanconi anemia group D2 protein [Plutella xylostella]|uniref:Fanconi anemia group D2 protein n=1 Tax=Plutella xylostella TaxID=51655 RepID=UPI002032202F|nr:Fanconi anemia group D2 protein [Plutella xylostella]
MSSKRTNGDDGSQSKRIKTIDTTNSAFQKLLKESGLTIKYSPDKCLASEETIHIVRNIKKNLQNQFDYPRNVSEVFNCFSKECQDLDVFKQYLFPNIVKQSEDTHEEYPVSDSVIKILLSVPIMQDKIIELMFEKAMDLAVENKCGPWIQMILKCISSLDTIVNTEKMSTNLIDLLDVANENIVRLEIITAIPDIIGDQEHQNIANEMSRFLSEHHELIPAILDCLTYLCLSDEQCEQLQKKTLDLLTNLPKCNYFPNFINFLLMSGRMTDTSCLEAIQGLRNSLGWPTTVATAQEIATSQVLTAQAIRASAVGSKAVGNSWIKAISLCKTATDHRPIDIIILILLYSANEERQKQVENLIKKQIKMNILKENLLDDAFEKYKPILREHLHYIIELANSLLKMKSDPLLQSFASHIYALMLSELDECRPTVIAELLQLGLDCKQNVMNILLILTNVANKDMSLLKPQSLQMLTLLDRMDGMSITEIRAVMNLVCGLAYTFENSIIRDDIHMIIRKELSSSSPTIKVQGILAGIYAIKYLMASTDHEDNTVDFPDDVSYSSVNYLSEGPLKEAAQIIELISRSTKQFPDMSAFFYDELSEVVSTATHINKHFMLWLTDAVTNDLQQNFIVDSIPTEHNNSLKLSMQYCLNSDSETDELIAINIGGLATDSNSEINVSILSPLFQLIQTLHYKQHNGNLSSIDALLGCPVVMPKLDIYYIEDMDKKNISDTLDCLVHCANWFRELLNAFATQNDEALKSKILLRILNLEELETLIGQVLLRSKISYKAPACTFDMHKYTGENLDKKAAKAPQPSQAKSKKTIQEESVLLEVDRTQATQTNKNSSKSNIEYIQNIPLRTLSLKLLYLFKNDLSPQSDPESELNIRTLKFLLKCVNNNLDTILMSKIKKTTFLTKQETIYEPKKAEECVKNFHEVLPKIMEHLKIVTTFIESTPPESLQNENGTITSDILDYVECLESIYKMLSIYVKWLGFKNNHTAVLKSSLRIMANNNETSAIVSLKDLTVAVAKYFQKHEPFCLQLSTASSLIELLLAIREYSDNSTVLNILRDLSNIFLCRLWRNSDGALEKGLLFNQCIDKLTSIYMLNKEIVALKNLTLQLTSDIQYLKTKNDTLNTLKCISKSNFPILFRSLGTAVFEATKFKINKGLTNAEHLDLWKDVFTVLQYMTDISKALDSRNNLSAFFKKSLPILRLFLTQGVPIIEIQFKDNTQEVLEILKILQRSTRFLQSLCCHSRLKKDSALLSKVPLMRQLLETLIYKVKAALAANNCSEAFWMGNLKNKDIHGEIIATQQSIEDGESVEDCDDQLPVDSDDSDEDMLNPDSKSISDVL